MKKRLLELLVMLLVLFLVCAACATVPLTGRSQLALVSAGEMSAMSVDAYRQILRESKLSKDPREVELVQRVGKRVAAVAEMFLKENKLGNTLQYYQWQFNVIDDAKTINAFCMPGGRIAVYTGILPYTQDETGLAVVMGHEAAHALANHAGERMSQLLLVELGGVALQEALKKEKVTTQALALMAYGLGSQIGILLPYSRQHETEADRIGLTLMARAGYDPRQAPAFWERMARAGDGKRAPVWLSTHPVPAQRIKDMQMFMTEAMRHYKPL
jgi:predicted Zn-dependent protease